MAKRLTTQDRIKRARAEGYSRKQLAQAFGVSVSAVGRAERGQTSGATIKAQAEQFFKLGKRAKSNVASGSASLPSARTPRPKKIKAPLGEPDRQFKIPAYERGLAKGEAYLAKIDGDTLVVVQLKYDSGKSRWLWTKGGIEASEIRGRLKEAIEEQADRQGRINVGSISDPHIEWDSIIDLNIEEY